LGKVLITARSVAASKEGKTVLESAGHEIVAHAGDRPWGEEEMLRVIEGMDAAIVGLDTVTAKVLTSGNTVGSNHLQESLPVRKAYPAPDNTEGVQGASRLRIER